MKKIFAAILAVGFLVVAPASLWATGNSTVQAQVDRLVEKYLRLSTTASPHSAYAFEDHFQNTSPYYKIAMDEGASKGFSAYERDGTAFDGATALALNYLQFGPYILGHSPVVNTGDDTAPTMDATGLDLNAGNNTDNDAEEVFGGMLGAVGRPLVVGTDPASKFCVSMAVNDVSATDQVAIGWRTPSSTATLTSASIAASVVLDTVYSNYATIGLLSGAVTTWTATGSDAGIATDLASITDIVDSAGFLEYCVLVSATGAVTYTHQGSTSASAVAYTFTDGQQVIPFLYFLQNGDADGDDDVLIQRWEVSRQ